MLLLHYVMLLSQSAMFLFHSVMLGLLQSVHNVPFEFCIVSVAVCNALFAICNAPVVFCSVPFEFCSVPVAVCYATFAVCKVIFVICSVQVEVCNVPVAFCNYDAVFIVAIRNNAAASYNIHIFIPGSVLLDPGRVSEPACFRASLAPGIFLSGAGSGSWKKRT